MAKQNIKITLDTMESKYSPVGAVKQLDSVFFNIKITDQGIAYNLTGQTIKLFARKEDKKLVEQTTKINITQPTEGLVEIELLNAAVQVPGFVYFELEISDAQGTISTADFILRVNRKVGSDEAIESTNEVATLKEIEIYVAQAKIELGNFKKLQDEMLQTNKNINSQESFREENERNRISNENDRIETLERLKSELTKVDKVIKDTELNSEELRDSRTATTGEKFNSLDDRLDAEVDRLKRKIEVTMLEQVQEYSHTIKNTLKGMTTDMVVKGMTLHNLLRREKYIFATNIQPSNYNKIENINSCEVTINNYESGKYYFINGGLVNFSLLKPNTQYTVIADCSDGLGVIIQQGNSTNHLSTRANIVNGKALITTTDLANGDNGQILYVYMKDNIPGEKQYIKNIVLLEGDYTNKKITSYFEGVKSFGELESNKITIISQNDNFLCNLKRASIDVGTGEETSSDVYFASDYVVNSLAEYHKALLDNDYILTNVFYYDSDKKYTGNQLNITGLSSFNSDKRAKFVRFVGRREDRSNNVDLNNIKIVIGSKKYIEYFKGIVDKKDILIPTPLRSCEDIQDIMFEENKNIKITRNIDLYEFTGDETIRDTTAQDEKSGTGKYKVFNITVDKTIDINKNMNNNFPKKSFNLNFQNMDSEGLGVTRYGIYIKILKSKLSTQDVEGFKVWLKHNTTTIYYALDSPTIEVIEGIDIDLNTFESITHINILNILPGTLGFKVPVDTTGTIQRLNLENKNLNEENIKLRNEMEEATLYLADSDLELIKQNVDLDFRVMEIEFTLDVPMNLSNQNIKFINKKGEIKSMARTPYEMMKIVILSGDYDREDYMKKAKIYFDRGRMTKEEYDELISLMTADEVIG